jgi:hypothetical protein
VKEPSLEQERPAQPVITQFRARYEVRRLDEHRTVGAPRVGRGADPIRHPIVPRRRLAGERSIVLKVLDPTEGAERGLLGLLELSGA